jgi:hypothetical protein
MSQGTRRIAAPTLAVLAALVLLATVVVGYANDAFFDSEEFADRATAALNDDAVRAEVATRVTDDVVLHAQADLIGVRPVIESVVDGLVGGSVFQSVLRSGVRDAHRAVFDKDANTVTLTLADIGQVLRGALEALRPKIAEQIPGGVDIDVTEFEPPSWLPKLARVADQVGLLQLILFAIGVALVAASLWLSVDRRRTMVRFGVALVICGVVAVVALGVVKAVLLARIDEAGTRDAIDGVWSAFLGDLTTTLYLFAGCGAVVAAAASSLLRPVDIGRPVRDGFALIATIPERRWLRFVRALALIAAGVLIIVERDAFVDLVVILIALYIAYAGVSELMRMLLPTEEAEVSADRAKGGRALIATAVTSLVILVAGAVFIGAGGTDEEPLEVETVGCNGAEELCDRPVNEVAFPATHNAMSAATNPGWLFAQQDAGFADQLHDGIRGLLIDAHYGTPTEGGAIKTDLSKLDGPERQVYEQELGKEGLEAALRIRDRIVDSPATGPRQVYLCHRFCELGAIPINEAFKLYRDFLAANPDEVLVIDIEDYVSPTDIDKAVRKSGLIDYVYTGPVGPPWPTLQEMIDSGGRALMLAENEDGGSEVPYYHAAYDELLQETPYSYKKPNELTDPDLIGASCKPNRGPRSASLFLLNHWIDTSPTPKPSNAAKVNAAKPLLARIRLCEQRRDLVANLIAVDFYREGDLFEVARELNSEPPP